MKDILLAILSCIYFSLIVQIETSKRTHINITKLVIAILVLYLLFSTRAYLAAFLTFSTCAYFVLSSGKIAQKLAMILVLAGAAYFSGALDLATEFLLDPEKNWLMSEEVAQQQNEHIVAAGSAELRVNYTPSSIFVGMVKFLITPIPKLNPQNVLEGVLIFQTIFSLYFLLPVFNGLILLRFHHARILFYSQTILVVLFYGIAQVFSGPRQRFSTLDILLIFFAAHYLSETGTSKEKAKVETKFNVVLGLGLNFISLFITGLTRQ